MGKVGTRSYLENRIHSGQRAISETENAAITILEKAISSVNVENSKITRDFKYGPIGRTLNHARGATDEKIAGCALEYSGLLAMIFGGPIGLVLGGAGYASGKGISLAGNPALKNAASATEYLQDAKDCQIRKAWKLYKKYWDGFLGTTLTG